jgi:hypothetical protein
VFADEWPTECLIGPEIESSRDSFLSKGGVQLLEDSSDSRRACARVRDEDHEARIRSHQQDQSFNPESEDDVIIALEEPAGDLQRATDLGAPG